MNLLNITNFSVEYYNSIYRTNCNYKITLTCVGFPSDFQMKQLRDHLGTNLTNCYSSRVADEIKTTFILTYLYKTLNTNKFIKKFTETARSSLEVISNLDNDDWIIKNWCGCFVHVFEPLDPIFANVIIRQL